MVFVASFGVWNVVSFGQHPADALHVVTWNIAAINDNPFEYWITYDNQDYKNMMRGVQDYVQNPGAHGQEPAVSDIFTERMLEELMDAMEDEGWDGLEETRLLWQSDFSKRKIVTGFLADKDIGKKRLASMPDRVTNTIRTQGGGTVHRPTVINCYGSGAHEPKNGLSSIGAWWQQWKEFMFEREVTLHGTKAPAKVCSLLQPISAKKYPALSAEEAAISIPLQTLSQAIFDAIMVHMMNQVTSDTWQVQRAHLCNDLNSGKAQRTLSVLDRYAATAAVIFLSESASSLATDDVRAWKELHPTRALNKIEFLHPAKMDTRRDQNSLIGLATDRWQLESVHEVTEDVNQAGRLHGAAKPPWSQGDVYAITVLDKEGAQYLLASFHGDTNGLLTVPFMRALLKARKEGGAGWPKRRKGGRHEMPRLVVGLDANTYQEPKDEGWLGVDAFLDFLGKKGLSSCWADGDGTHLPKVTTYNGRTYLQPQLNKATSSERVHLDGDHNPKDYIVFDEATYEARSTGRDNTGSGYYVDTVFPTLEWPSDHALVSTHLVLTDKAKRQVH